MTTKHFSAAVCAVLVASVSWAAADAPPIPNAAALTGLACATQVKPVYPPEALKLRADGFVVAQVKIVNGRVEDVSDGQTRVEIKGLWVRFGAVAGTSGSRTMSDS